MSECGVNVEWAGEVSRSGGGVWSRAARKGGGVAGVEEVWRRSAGEEGGRNVAEW